MSFRKFGGLNYNAKNNIVKNHYGTSDNFQSTETIGQPNSKMVSLSHIDMSQNSIMNVGGLYFYGNNTPQTQPFLSSDIDGVFAPLTNPVGGSSNYAPLNSPDFSGIPTAPSADSGTSSYQIATTAFVHNVITDISGIYAPLASPNFKSSIFVTNDKAIASLCSNSSGLFSYLDFRNMFYIRLIDRTINTLSVNIITIDMSGNNIYTTPASGTITIVCPVNAPKFQVTSDYRIKENVENIDIGKYNIDKLRPVSYINKFTNTQDFGLIAHEIQKEFPSLVSGEKNGETNQSVNYIGLIAILIKEIQELKVDVQLLKQML